MLSKMKNIKIKTKNRDIRQTQGGYALLTALMFFLAATTAVLAGLSDSVLREVRVIRQESLSKQSYFTSESALEDSIYRIEVGKKVNPSGILAVASSSAAYTVTTVANGIQQIFSSADQTNTERNTQATVDTGILANFKYALQTGDGGIDLYSSTITGDAYTTGSIRGHGQSNVTGAAIAAGKSYSNIDSTNEDPMPPVKFITFGNSPVTEDVAESFTVSQPLSVTDLQIFIKKTGSPSNATVRIVTDSASAPGTPSDTVLASGTLSSSLVDSQYSWQDIPMSSNPVLAAGKTYWFVIDANADSSSYFVIAANTVFIGGNGSIGSYDTQTWYDTSPSGLDTYFKLSIGANQSGITGESQYVPLAVGSAYAYNVSSVTAIGNIYCQIGNYNNKSCDTSRSDPAIEAYPVSTSTIAGWKTEASAAGVHVGNYTVGSVGDTLGAQKIQGNLTIGNAGTLYVTGTLWVTGSINIVDGAKVSPGAGSKSFAILSDIGITVSGGATITGLNGSHIMLVSTSVDDPAITVNGGSSDTVLFAPYGGILVSGGARAKAAAAYHIVISGGANVTYDPDMSQLIFSSGSIGGPGVKSWKEVE
jgi:Tfp pilus assembly protein PilX